jgi:MFS transporter, PAT family, solute carrier family 33 (acetyl-CoA transportor), member 1
VSPLLLLSSLFFPAIASSLVTRKPLQTFRLGIICKLCLAPLLWLFIQYTTFVYAAAASSGQEDPPLHYYICLAVVMLLNDCAGNLVFVSCMAFFAQVSDPGIGGCYMTLLNTIANLGAKWPSVLCLYLLPKLTFYDTSGGNKELLVDGLTVLAAVGVGLGLVWLRVFSPLLTQLQGLGPSDWRIESSSSKSS